METCFDLSFIILSLKIPDNIPILCFELNRDIATDELIFLDDFNSALGLPYFYCQLAIDNATFFSYLYRQWHPVTFYIELIKTQYLDNKEAITYLIEYYDYIF